MENLLPASLYDIAPLIPALERGDTILAPNFRLARRIKAQWDRHMADAGNRVWESAPVFPLQGWLQLQWEIAVREGRVSPLTLLSADQELELWRQVIVDTHNAEDEFALLQPAAAASMAALARDSLLLWQVDINLPRWRSQFELDKDCSSFLVWCAEFENRLQENGLATHSDCLSALAACQPPEHPTSLSLVECRDIPPLQQALLKSLCAQVTVVESGEPGDRLLHSFLDKRAELRGIAHWAEQVHRDNPDDSIGIVLTNMQQDRQALEYLLRSALDCLGEHYTSLPVNFSTGLPLAHTPVVRDALRALEMGLPRTSVPEIVQLMQSRFLTLADASSPLAMLFIERLFAAGVEQLEVKQVRTLAAEVHFRGREKNGQGLALGDILLTLGGMRELRSKALPSVWAQRFSDVLEHWGWPGSEPLDSLEFQQMKLWYEVIEGLKSYDVVCGQQEYAGALRLLRESCLNKMSQPETADGNIQVLGTLEAVGLQFDHLWVTGLEASSWPPPARPNPFIPNALQAALDMPHASAQREWAVSEGRINQYARSSGALHASYCRQADGVTELPSAMLSAFDEVEMTVPPEVAPLWSERWLERRIERLSDIHAPAVNVESESELTGGSALIEDQSQCPFRAFARHRLQIRVLGEFSLALSAAERGSIMHDALFALWTQIEDHAALLALDDSSEAAVLESAAKEGFARVNRQRKESLGATYWELENLRLQGLLREWLALERKRSDFVVRALEEEVVLELAQLKLVLRIDRIDELPTGERIVMDYKSSASRVKDWLGERPAKPQLLLYGIASPDNVAGIAFAQVRPDDCKFVGLAALEVADGIKTDIAAAVSSAADAQVSPANWAELNDQWRLNLQELAQNFISGDAEVDPLNNNSCTWCGLQSLCRVAQADDALYAADFAEEAE